MSDRKEFIKYLDYITSRPVENKAKESDNLHWKCADNFRGLKFCNKKTALDDSSADIFQNASYNKGNKDVDDFINRLNKNEEKLNIGKSLATENIDSYLSQQISGVKNCDNIENKDNEVQRQFCTKRKIDHDELDEIPNAISPVDKFVKSVCPASPSTSKFVFRKSFVNKPICPISKTLNTNCYQDTKKDNKQPPTSKEANEFRTGREELIIQNMKKYGKPNNPNSNNKPLFDYGLNKKSLGARRFVQNKFVPPIQQKEMETSDSDELSQELIDDRLKHIEPEMIERIKSEIMNIKIEVKWEQIAGLDYAKSIIQEVVIWPLLRPDIFTGLRRPPRGILLFGPPGTGKTLIGKCIASQAKSTFFSISASSLTSKWIGDGEKMVRALFSVASVYQPAVIFIDEIDSLLSQRNKQEHESSRRIKTEFLVQLDGATTSGDERILIVGATNRPQELDEAARRRLVKRLYIPLPEFEARIQMLSNLLKDEHHNLTIEDLNLIAKQTDGYSGADMKTLCQEASMGPIRSVSKDKIHLIDSAAVRPTDINDFNVALTRVRASVSQDDLLQYIQWDKLYGSGGC